MPARGIASDMTASSACFLNLVPHYSIPSTNAALFAPGRLHPSPVCQSTRECTSSEPGRSAGDNKNGKHAYALLYHLGDGLPTKQSRSVTLSGIPLPNTPFVLFVLQVGKYEVRYSSAGPFGRRQRSFPSTRPSPITSTRYMSCGSDHHGRGAACILQ
jgi:hypothetical protein